MRDSHIIAIKFTKVSQAIVPANQNMSTRKNKHNNVDKKRAVGLFANAQFFPCLVAMINSLHYFKVNADIKVYDYGGMNHLLRTYLQHYVKVICIDDPLLNDDGMFLHAWNWRPRITRSYLEGVELFLDADMVILNDLSEIFAYLEQGYFVGSRELTFHYDKDEDQYRRDGEEWKKIIGTASFAKRFDIYNAGFYGFNINYHGRLLDLWNTSSRVRQFHENTPFYWEQWTFSLILEHEKQNRNVKIKNMPKHLWMNTWDHHADPKKFLGFHDGQVCVRDANTNETLGLYHYTGFPGFTDKDIRGKLFHATKEDLVENSALDREDTSAFFQDKWYELWEKTYNSPVALLYDYMYQRGPLRTPSTFNLDFRKKVARILRIVLDHPNIDYKSKEVFAIAIAYDYLNLLSFRLKQGGWMEKPLKMLCEKDVYRGAKTISWDSAETDVALNFHPPYKDSKSWIDCSWCKRNIEHINGLNIIINA